MNYLASGLVCATVLSLAVGDASRAQTRDQWNAMQQLQADIKTDRQAVVAGNLPLTATEAAAFWPVYQAYRADVERLDARVSRLIAAYAANIQTIDSEKADAYFREMMSIEQDKLRVREAYVLRAREVLPVIKAARFFQIENKLDALVMLTIAAEVPLVPVQKKAVP